MKECQKENNNIIDECGRLDTIDYNDDALLQNNEESGSESNSNNSQK